MQTWHSAWSKMVVKHPLLWSFYTPGYILNTRSDPVGYILMFYYQEGRLFFLSLCKIDLSEMKWEIVK